VRASAKVLYLVELEPLAIVWGMMIFRARVGCGAACRLYQIRYRHTPAPPILPRSLCLIRRKEDAATYK